MELKEISATSHSPYRCYVRGNQVQSEGDNVYTIGFKDGLAVVQVNPTTKNSTDMMDKKFHKDNGASLIDSKAIDLTKLKKIIVKVDPITGKKYIVRDGRRIEILPQIQNPVLNLTVKSCGDSSLKPATLSTCKLEEVSSCTQQIRRNIIIKSPQNLTPYGRIINGTLYPKIAPKQQRVVQVPAVKVMDNVKYQVVSLNVKKQGESLGKVATTVSTMTDSDLNLTSDKTAQTDSCRRRDSYTQTEPRTGRDSPFSEYFFNFILEGDGDADHTSEVNMKRIDLNKLTTKEEINKYNFFNDMRTALNFDRSGNLPIHVSVMQNSFKAVQKNCIVLKAIRENVNIVNQQGYTSLHLAIIHDVNLEIVKVLLNYGADVSVADGEGNTALHLAIENQRSEMFKVLVMWAYETRCHLDVFNYEGFTPLILACLNGSYDDAKLLLHHGADPNVKDMKSGRTALFHAAECFNVKLVELLMEYKADTKIRNFFGTSAHDAMFEVEDMPLKIKFCILGRDHQRIQNKRKAEAANSEKKVVERFTLKRTKLETTPVLRRVSANDMNLVKSKRK